MEYVRFVSSRCRALFPEKRTTMLKKHVEDREKKFLDPSLCPHRHQKIMESILGRHPFSIQVLWKSAQYFLCSHADKQTNQPTTYKLTNMGENMTFRNNETRKISVQLVPAGTKALHCIHFKLCSCRHQLLWKWSDSCPPARCSTHFTDYRLTLRAGARSGAQWV